MQNRRAATRLEAAAPFATKSVSGTGDPNPGEGRAIPARTVRANVSRDRFTAPPIRPAPAPRPKDTLMPPGLGRFSKIQDGAFSDKSLFHYILYGAFRRIVKNVRNRPKTITVRSYHTAPILILRRLRAATPAKNKDAFRHPYRNDSLNRPERSVRRRHTCHVGFQPATNAVPRHSPNKLALHSAHNIFY